MEWKIIENYINNDSEPQFFNISDIFETNEDGNDAIEQIILSSNGNMRRLINLFDLSMSESYKIHPDECFVTKNDTIATIMEHASSIESLFSDNENVFLNKIVEACKSRGTYRFRFPSMSPILYKFTNKSEEFNIINIDEIGSGSRGNTYSFDYAYCILKNIPSHYLSSTEKIDKR